MNIVWVALFEVIVMNTIKATTFFTYIIAVSKLHHSQYPNNLDFRLKYFK